MVRHSDMQAGMVLEKEVIILYLYPKATGNELKYWSLDIYETQCLPPQWHIFFNKATDPNNASPYEFKGANNIQTTTNTHLHILIPAYTCMNTDK